MEIPDSQATTVSDRAASKLAFEITFIRQPVSTREFATQGPNRHVGFIKSFAGMLIMLSNLLKNNQKLVAAVAMSVCAAGSASAGLFCNLECCQQTRPYFSPACEPAWGYHKTCWRKFPELEPCSGWGDYCPSCPTGGDSLNANAYHTQMMPPQGSPILQGAPTVIQQPTQSYAQPIQSYAPPTQSYSQPTQSYGQPVPQQPQPMPMQSAPSMNSAPRSLTPIPQPQGSLPTGGGMMPPIPDSAMRQQMPGNYCPVSQQRPQGYLPTQGNVQTNYATQQMPPANATQGLPIRAASFSRVRPSTAKPVVAPKRTLLQRILPGGK